MNWDFRFDIRGYLQPAERYEVSLNNFKEIFVDAFEDSTTREIIFKQFLEFNHAFSSAITPNFTQWLNGSFVSNKNNPNDLDILILINSEDFIKRKPIIDEKFRLLGAKNYFPLLDIYTITIFQKEDPQYFTTAFDLIYWDDFWGKARMNRAKKYLKKDI